MRVAVLTLHYLYNFGSALQALALQRQIESLRGVSCDILDYRPVREGLVFKYPWEARETPLLWPLKPAVVAARLVRRWRFAAFRSQSLHLTKRIDGATSISSDRLDYDYFICGSDQIWNLDTRYRSDAYFLPLVEPGRKIAYAPSLGAHTARSQRPDRVSRLRHHLADFKTVSVREAPAQRFLHEITGREISLVPDPTLLLARDEWDLLAQSKLELEPDRYVFFYTIGYDDDSMRFVRQLADHFRMPVVVAEYLHTREILSPFTKAVGSGPKDFLWLVKNAHCVYTTSFHGMIFSILFEKPFWCYVGKGDDRKTTVLSRLQLEARAVRPGESFAEKLDSEEAIDYRQVGRRLADFREEGRSFLAGSLDSDQCASGFGSVDTAPANESTQPANQGAGTGTRGTFSAPEPKQTKR